jgi:predicted NBD/HSP70 family sugar kinase
MGGKNNIRNFSICPEDQSLKDRMDIFAVIKEGGEISSGSLSGKTGIDEKTVSAYLDSWKNKGLVAGSGGGGLAINGPGRKLLGLGFSDDKCHLALVDLGGSVLEEESIDIAPIMGLKGKRKEVKEIVNAIKAGSGISRSGISAAGIAVSEHMLDLVPKSANVLAEGVAEIFKCDVFLSQGATCAAYGEKETGAGKGIDQMLYIHSDVGSGVMFKGDLIFEAENSSPDDKSSFLRSWKQFNVVSTAKELVNKGVGTDIVNMVGGNTENITLGIVLQAAEKNDELAEDLIKRSGLALGVRVAYLANMLTPAKVILGGGIDRKEGNFIKYVKEAATRFLLNDIKKGLEIVPGQLGEGASSKGGSLLCRRELFMEG